MGTWGVHDDSTRAAQHRHRGGGLRAAGRVAVFICAAAACLATGKAFSAPPAGVEISSLPAGNELPARRAIVRDIAIETVAAGKEGFELTARLSEDGELIGGPIGWTLRLASGEPVFAGEAPDANIVTAPGDYTVDIRYGAVRLSQTMSLAPGTRLIASFVLDAGGIRILPRVQGHGLPAATPISYIYSRDGDSAGQLVAKSSEPGEILRVPAGRYRVESRFATGNTMALADIEVKPGLMSAVEIDHAAGLARLAFVGSPAADVYWRVSDDRGAIMAPIRGLNADVVLRPGSYSATAEIGGEILTARFSIAAGELRDIILGN